MLTKRVRKSYRRVTALVEAGAPEDPAHRDEWYHEIRKASKRLRYAAESVAPAFGEPATALAEAAEDLQEVLGEHQDSVVARAALRQLGVRIHLDGDNAFTIGRLHAWSRPRVIGRSRSSSGPGRRCPTRRRPNGCDSDGYCATLGRGGDQSGD